MWESFNNRSFQSEMKENNQAFQFEVCEHNYYSPIYLLFQRKTTSMNTYIHLAPLHKLYG